MPLYGPWLTPPLQTTDVPLAGAEFPLGIEADGVDFAALCETGPSDVPIGPLSPTFAQLQNLSGRYFLYQLQWSYSFGLGLLGSAFVDYIPPVLPPDAVGVGYEGFPGGDFLPAITNIHATITVADVTSGVTPISVGLQLLAEPPADLHYPFAGSGLPDYHWLSGTQIAARTALGTATLGSGATSVVLDADLPVADIDTTHGTSDGRRNLLVDLVFDAQVTHTAPADGTGRWITVSNYGGLVTYQPGRYRFIYDAIPPLRQRQRPTGVGAAAGPPLRQRATLGDAAPPLRQRGML